jgi:hypothetical protein
MSEFHVIYTDSTGVHECNVMADDYEAAEAEIKRAHPDATFWEIGIPVRYVIA